MLRYQRLGDAVWYQVRLGCQEFIDSGFVMSVVPRTLTVHSIQRSTPSQALKLGDEVLLGVVVQRWW
ncbi:hypothetical protein [Anaplasma marginale]|uniref:hypothetical protein n=1 Tax=Anaplasma marginale TaxID=770 RepID=UPI00123B8D76|nr:hypothetical protein [Anaplasma marginale]KAA8472042.1 hypothetical protein F0Q58_04770 [Anaplasma marginale]